MHASIRSCPTTGVATITAAAVAFVPSVAEPAGGQTSAPVVHVVSRPFELTAAVKPAAAPTELPHPLSDWLNRVLVPPSASATAPTPPTSPVVGGTSIDSVIKNTYNAIEPWVRYGFELATYAVGWVPYVGWLAPQIMIFYTFGERIARSVAFNIADFLGGNVSFLQGLRNVAVDTINSFIHLANDELAFWLPPLPPIPPLPGGSIVGPSTATLTVPAVEGPAAKTPLAGRMQLDVREHLLALAPKPRAALRAVESALDPARTEQLAPVDKLVKRLPVTSRQVVKTSESDVAQTSQPKKPLRQLKDAIRAATTPKAGSSDGSGRGVKDRGLRAARHARADAKG